MTLLRGLTSFNRVDLGFVSGFVVGANWAWSGSRPLVIVIAVSWFAAKAIGFAIWTLRDQQLGDREFMSRAQRRAYLRRLRRP